MPEKIIEDVLSGKLDVELVLAWLRDGVVEGAGEESALRRCSRGEFAACFISYLRTQTESLVGSGGAGAGGAAGLTPSRQHRRSVSDPTHADARAPRQDRSGAESPVKEKRRAGRRVKTKLFPSPSAAPAAPSPAREPPPGSDDSSLSAGVESLSLTSTPLKKWDSPSSQPSPTLRCDTPRTPSGRAPADPPRAAPRPRPALTLGDYLPAPRRRRRGDRPERKASSERRRIKPTNIPLDTKSTSLSSFEGFQRSPLALEDNAAFRADAAPSPAPIGFHAERSALRDERQRLRDKFHSIATPIVAAPGGIEKQPVYITADATRVTLKDKLDVLVEIYDAMLNLNLILGYTGELAFLISILLSKQAEDSCSPTDLAPLSCIHNAGYFAGRVLTRQMSVLGSLLGRGALRALGARAGRGGGGNCGAGGSSGGGAAPELAKSALDAYAVRSDSDMEQTQTGGGSGDGGGLDGGGVVAWHAETDAADNFPSALSFHAFKKQRDMFYDIVRWYNSAGGEPALAGGGASLRSRLRALLAAGAEGGVANRVHLAGLFVRHLLAACSRSGDPESRLSKLQRRLTRPAPAAAPLFNPEEDMYREMLCSSECAGLRAHVADALAGELRARDAAPLDGGSSSELVTVVRCSSVLARFLGLLAALPYAGGGGGCGGSAGGGYPPHQPVPDQLLRNYIALRNHSQPALDLAGMLARARASRRLLVTLPWLCAHLAALDYTALRLRYYTELLRSLQSIYLGLSGAALPPARLYLKCTLAGLFSLPHVPQEILYEDTPPPTPLPDDPLSALVSPALLATLGARRALGALLAGGGAAAGGRHVTPLRVGAAPHATARERELQTRLEEQLLLRQSAATRRVIELTAERVASRCHRELLAALHPHRAAPAHTCSPLCLSPVRRAARAQVGAALGALLTLGAAGGAGGAAREEALEAAAARAVRGRLARALRDYTAPGALCPAARAELQSLLSANWARPSPPSSPLPAARSAPPSPRPTPPSPRSAPPTLVTPPPLPVVTPVPVIVSVAEAIMDLKEVICCVLEGGAPGCIASVLQACAASCAPDNPVCRPPARRALLQLSLDLCVVLACHRPSELPSLLPLLEALWAAAAGRPPPPPEPEPALEDSLPPREGSEDSRAPTPVSDGEGAAPPLRVVIAPLTPGGIAPVTSPAAASTPNHKTPPPSEDELLSLFPRIVCVRNVVLLSRSTAGEAGWRALAALLVRLVRAGWLAGRALADRCVRLYRHDWPQSTLANLSVCLHIVSEEAELGDKLALFVSFLAEYCADLTVPDSDAELLE